MVQREIGRPIQYRAIDCNSGPIPMTKQTNPPPLAETEWNFESVPPDELEACYFYEYSREYFKQSRVLLDLHKRWADQVHCNFPAAWQEFEKAVKIFEANGKGRAIFDFRTFPHVSWQDLRKLPQSDSWPVEFGIDEGKERQGKREYKGDRFHIETLAQLAPASIKSLPTWIYYHEFFRQGQDLSNTEYGFVAINWDYPLSEIRRAFSEWLKERTRERKSEPKFLPKSRGGFKDRLHWLGALRVKKHYRYRDLVDYDDSNLKVEAPCSHYPDLLKNADKAVRLIAEMFPSEKDAAQIVSEPLEDSAIIPAEKIPPIRS